MSARFQVVESDIVRTVRSPLAGRYPNGLFDFVVGGFR
jgi:hypothetical protein